MANYRLRVVFSIEIIAIGVILCYSALAHMRHVLLGSAPGSFRLEVRLVKLIGGVGVVCSIRLKCYKTISSIIIHWSAHRPFFL